MNFLDRLKNATWQGFAVLVFLNLLEYFLDYSLNLFEVIDPKDSLPGDYTLNIIVAVLIIICWIANWEKAARYLLIFYAFLFTVNLLMNVGYLITNISAFQQGRDANKLMSDALLLWLTNVVIFSVWYWLVDGGGQEERKIQQEKRDFIFPLYDREPQEKGRKWNPTFFDYIFLSFCTSTAYSPTDTTPLTARVKVLMMIQSFVSLILFAVIVARAINIVQ